VSLAHTGLDLYSHWTVLPAAVLFALPVAAVDRYAMILWRRGNWKIMARAEAFMRLGRIRQVRLFHLAGIGLEALYAGTTFLVCTSLLLPLFTWFLKAHPGKVPLLSVAGVLPFYMGLAALADKRLRGRSWTGFAAGIGLALVLGTLGLI
jgi:mannose/fructose/N-acetylgalactosamine-specific phosphotransferase system component IIC